MVVDDVEGGGIIVPFQISSFTCDAKANDGLCFGTSPRPCNLAPSGRSAFLLSAGSGEKTYLERHSYDALPSQERIFLLRVARRPVRGFQDTSNQRTQRYSTMDQAHIRVLGNAGPSVRRGAASV